MPDVHASAGIERPWSLSPDEVSGQLGVSADDGLSADEILRRRAIHGKNQLVETKAKSILSILADQFKSLIVVLLTVAALVSIAFDEILEGAAIVIVILINSSIGFVTELRAVRSMEALRTLGQVSTRVRREKKTVDVPADELVPGDIVVLEGGDVVTADIRILTSSKLQADESTLTGESLPVSKDPGRLAAEIPLAERTNMLYKGTAVTRGSGEGIVVSTGMSTELGTISSLVEESVDEATPLEDRLDQLGRRLIWATLIVVAVVAVGGIMSGREVLLMVQTSIALAVATVPEGLPIVATIALARGMLRMARRNALINQLSAVETLGSTTVICTDKTGTLTENKLTVGAFITRSGRIDVCPDPVGGSWFEKSGALVDPGESPLLKEALEISVLCNNASLQPEDLEGKDGVGDPLEVALLAAGVKGGVSRGELVEKRNLRKVGEEAFDSVVKMMATIHTQGVVFRVAVKGAPEMVLGACERVRTENGTLPMKESDRQHLLEQNDEMGKEGFRVLALATKTVRNADARPYQDLVFVALVGLRDPPRKGVRQSISSCLRAGIKVIMATGDQAVTAGKVATEVGLVDDGDPEVVSGGDLKPPADLSPEEREKLLGSRIFARVTPGQKLDLIALHQDDGQVVAMTGDGVNDAPALKKADIGVAMGVRGTQVAREASDMVLKDDSFSSIVTAVEQGRVIFDNIRKVVLFLLSCNISEIMIVGLASIFNAPLPLLPLQILFLNLVTDVFPALALGTGEGDPHIMGRRPRDPAEPILNRQGWSLIAGYGSVMTISVLAALVLSLAWLGLNDSQSVTVSFLTLAFAQLWHVFNMRDANSGIIRNEVTKNRFVWGSIALCTLLLIAAVGVPGLSQVLKTEGIGAEGWVLVVLMSSIVLVVGQVHKLLTSSR